MAIIMKYMYVVFPCSEKLILKNICLNGLRNLWNHIVFLINDRNVNNNTCPSKNKYLDVTVSTISYNLDFPSNLQ